MWLVGLLPCYKSKGYGIRYRGFNLVAWLGLGVRAGPGVVLGFSPRLR